MNKIYIVGVFLSIFFSKIESVQYETYLESWDSGWYSALTGLPPIPPTSQTNYNNVALNISFASYDFPGLNGLQFANTPTDVNTVINYVHGNQGLVKLAFGGASYAPGNYFISQTPGWPNNIPQLAAGIKGILDTYSFDGVDLDIEDSNPSGVTKEDFAAQLFSFIVQLRQALPTKIISLTIPAQGWGQYWEILAKQVAAAKPSPVNYINFMEYDIWVNPELSSFADQIKNDIITYISPTNTAPPTNYAAGWGIPPSLIQLGLMPGYDDNNQYLTISSAQDLTNFAIQQGLFGVMTWSLDRDAGTDPNPSTGEPPYAFSNAIRAILAPTTQLRKAKFNAASVIKPAIEKKKHRHSKEKKDKCDRACKKERIKGLKTRLLFVRNPPPNHGAPAFTLR